MSASHADHPNETTVSEPREPGHSLFANFDHINQLCLDDDPYSMLKSMRDTCPVGHAQTYGGSWVLTRYEDVWNVARDSSLFVSGQGVSLPSHGMLPLPPIESDAPIHSQFRRPLIPRFTPAAAAESAPHAQEVVNDLIDAFIEDGEADLAQQLTIPLPTIVNTPVLGIPFEDRAKFQAWAVALLASGGEDLEAIGSAMGYFDHLYELRRSDPGDDIPSLLIGLEIGGKPMDKTQFILTMIMLMTGGLDTTTNSGSHMLFYLGEHPAQRRLLVEEPDRIPVAVEELLRYLTPLPSLFRTAAAATALHGQAIAEGDKVQLCWMAANHDPAEFDDPENVDLSRSPNRHVAFGVGEHRCLGANLARMELRVLLEEALPRLGEYQIVKPPERYASVTRGISHLCVAFPPGKRIGGS